MAKTTRKTTTKTVNAAGSAAAISSKKKPVSKKAAAKKTVAKKVVAKKAAAKKAVAKKVAAKKAAAKKTAAKKKVGMAKKTSPGKAVVDRQVPPSAISAAARRQLIAEAAYLRAEACGFFSDEREDWLLAEAEVDERLAKAHVKVLG
jgi:hypothetical protein